MIALRNFISSVAKSAVALSMVPRAWFGKPARTYLKHIHRDHVIGMRWVYNGYEREFFRQVEAGEVWHGQVITNCWQDKFWMRDSAGNTEMVCLLFDSAGFCDLSNHGVYYKT